MNTRADRVTRVCIIITIFVRRVCTVRTPRPCFAKKFPSRRAPPVNIAPWHRSDFRGVATLMSTPHDVPHVIGTRISRERTSSTSGPPGVPSSPFSPVWFFSTFFPLSFYVCGLFRAITQRRNRSVRFARYFCRFFFFFLSSLQAAKTRRTAVGNDDDDAKKCDQQ